MKQIRKQKYSWARWGVFTFLMGVGFVLNANEPQVEALDFQNSHLGTFEGSTTFTTSSSTGVQPMLAIELKNQEGSTQLYDTSSGSLTILNTQEGATIKNAILKGQTLENLADLFSFETDITYSSHYYDRTVCETSNLKLNKAYLFAFKPNVSSNLNDYTTFEIGLSNSINITEEHPRTDTDNGKNYAVNGIKHNEWNYIRMVFTDFKGYKYLSVRPLRTSNPDSTKPITYNVRNGFMLIEYQEGMENWDIPYFTGKQSVKLPVLTITNGESEQIKNEQGQWVPNPAFQSTAITFEEEVILRSKGDIYDELDLMTGKLTQRLDENNEVLAKPIVRTVNMKAEPIFNAINQAEISVVGDVKATIASVTLPTTPLSFVLDPNNEPDQQFIASEFSITNDSQAPLTIELKEFVQLTDVLEDVLPDHYESWDYLTKEESKSIALGLVPQASNNWLTLNAGPYYVAGRQNNVIGRVKQKSTVDFSFTALHGQSFNKLPNPQYRLTFVFGF